MLYIGVWYRGLRTGMRTTKPTVYFHPILPGRYLAIWPGIIVGYNPEQLKFSVAIDYRNYVKKYSKARFD